jgi:hypothetical protein
MTVSPGRTLKLFLVDGVPNGLLTAEIMNWTGHVVTGPRSRLSEFIQRPESRRTGVYFLVGPDSGAGIGTQVYIGETDDVAQRLTAHNRPEDKGGKDFWEKVCVVTSKDANLTKGHIKYLESRLLRIAQQGKRCVLLNGTDPGYDNLPEADRSDMEFFLEQIRTLLPVLGMDFLRETPQAPTPERAASTAVAGQPLAPNQQPQIATAGSPASPMFVCSVRRHDISAHAQEINGEFVVLTGSTTRGEWEGVEGGYTQLFKELVRSGVLAPTADGSRRSFTRDYAFSSPSAAAAVVSGRSANGRIQWVTDIGGQTYGDWQESRVNAMLAELDSAAAQADGAPALIRVGSPVAAAS